MGELTDELGNGEYIVEFVSGGPKIYAYKTNKNNETCKVTEFTLKYKNGQLINFDSMKDIATAPQSSSNIAVTNPSKICGNKKKKKENCTIEKNRKCIKWFIRKDGK